MAFAARVIKVMVASPSDVTEERAVIRDVVAEWNAMHATDRRTVLLPVGWDTDSSPAMGGRPQAILNRQILRDSDLLIACFWKRLGSPTGRAPSGTVEEIQEHVRVGKAAMLYFSSVPVPPEDVDANQRDALSAFKDECRGSGLFEEYRTIDEFRRKVARQLAQTIAREFPEDYGPAQVATYESPVPAISDDALALLKAASRDSRGHLMHLRTMGGLSIAAGGRDFITDAGDARETARWEAAFEELRDAGLIKGVGNRDEVFNVTHEGFAVVDEDRQDDA